MSVQSLPRNNVPPQPGPFIGRENEVQVLTDLLHRPEIRCITLLGSGGTGKTRLSMRLAELHQDAYPDGVWFVALEPITDPDLVVPTITHTLGLQEAGSRPIADTLRAYLRDRRMLLILDNFEQVISAAGEVADVLRDAPAVQVIVSSRQALGIAGEHIYTVQPLPCPDLASMTELKEVARNPAVAVFVQRAMLVKPDFILTKENATPIASICTRLDGLPLTIELAASRIRQFPPQDLLPALDQSLEVLAGGSRDKTERQQTLLGLIEWSYNLLSVGEQMLFGRLAVFAGGCTEEAVAAICNIDDDLPVAVADALAGLVDKCLLRREIHGESVRYTMLNTIRDYATHVLSRLAPEGEETTIRQKHAAYFISVVETAMPLLAGSEGARWLDILEQEHDNLRVVLGGPDTESAARIAAGLYRFWDWRGYWSEGCHWARLLLASDELSLPLRLRLIFMLGQLSFRLSDNTAAEYTAIDGLSLARALGDVAMQARLLNLLGAIASDRTDTEAADRYYAESAACWAALGDKRGQAVVLGNRATLLADVGDYAQAEQLLTEAGTLDRDAGYMDHLVWVYAHLASVHLEAGHLEQAQAAAAKSEQLNATIGDSLIGAENKLYLGLAALLSESRDEARSALRAGATMLKALGEKVVLLQCLEGLAGLYGLSGDPLRAARLFGAAEAARAAHNFPHTKGEQSLHARLLALGRQYTDSATWEAAWAEGLRMTLDDAVADALTETENDP